MEVNGIPLEEREELIKKYYRYMDRYMRHALYGVHRSRWPALSIELNGGTYTNVRPEEGKRNYIHLDVGPTVCIEDEADFVNVCEVFIGHEVQHIRSTTDKGWVYGLNGGKLAICQEHQKASGRRGIVLRTPQDCDRYISALNADGYKISKNSIEEFVHFVMNSVEDGRIERIRCVQRPGFKKKLASFRGKSWLCSEMEEVTADQMNDPYIYTITVLNQVLSLSTMSISQKGFTKTCLVDMRTMDTVQALMPHIAKGVLSDSCRGGMKHAIEICRMLALDILEASKKTPLEELLEHLSQVFSSMASYSADSSNEEMDGSIGESLFGKSCIVIELEDEEFDRLEKEMKDKGQPDGDACVIFKRKHPKKEDEKKDQEQSGKETPGQEGGEEDGPSGQSGTGPSQAGDGGKSAGARDVGDFQEKPAADSGQGKKPSQDPGNKPDPGKQSASQAEAASNEAQIDRYISDAVKNTVKDADASLSEDAKDAERIASSDKVSEPAQTVIRTKEDTLPDFSSVNEAYDPAEPIEFHEAERDYTPNKRMPMDLLGRAETLKRRLMQILKNLEEPEVRERKSGFLDPAGVYKLALGNLDCFIKKGISSEFDGCVEILMDRSGSMGCGPGSKFQMCCEALAVIEHAFEDIMPMKIAAFEAHGNRRVRHEKIKDWHEKLPYGGAYNFLMNKHCGAGNKDGYSIRIATKELLSQPYTKKILIVLSDGLPSDYSGGYRAGMTDVYQAVQSARKQDIEVIPIYFGEGDKSEVSNFLAMYDRKNCIVTEPDLIGDHLYSILKTCVTGF